MANIIEELLEKLIVARLHDLNVNELRPYLGDRWADSPNTEKNRERYGITPEQYKAAQVKALAARMRTYGIDEKSLEGMLRFRLTAISPK